jgi:hypothetical protein
MVIEDEAEIEEVVFRQGRRPVRVEDEGEE